jgi:hypothetical protein
MTRITATFSVWSKHLQPEIISGILSMVPDRTVLRGVDRVPPRQAPDAYGWHLTCRDEDELLAEKTLLKLLDRLRGVEDRFVSLQQADENLDVRIILSVSPFDENISLFFSVETLGLMSKFHPSLDIEFFVESD